MTLDWTFASADLAESFDEYVRGQLPWYDLASGMVGHIARHYIPEHGVVYDLGAATGNMGRAMADTLTQRGALLTAVEQNPEMAARYDGPGIVKLEDARAYDFQPFDFAVSFLTLMFVPPADRPRLLTTLQARCRPGGAVLLVEKQDPPGGYAGTVMRRLTLAAKVAAGVSAADVLEKEISLFGIQRPLPADFSWGVELFRFGEFVGLLWEQPLAALTDTQEDAK